MLRHRTVRSNALIYRLCQPRYSGRSCLSTSPPSNSPPNAPAHLEQELSFDNVENARSALRESSFFTSTPITSTPLVKDFPPDAPVLKPETPRENADSLPLAQATTDKLCEKPHATSMKVLPTSTEAKKVKTFDVVKKAELKLKRKAAQRTKSLQRASDKARKVDTKISTVNSEGDNTVSEPDQEILRKKLLSLGGNALGLIRQAHRASSANPSSVDSHVSPKSNNALETSSVTIPKQRKPKSKGRTRIRAKKSTVANETSTEGKALAKRKLVASNLTMQAIAADHPPVKKLSYGLESVLFKQGAYNLQDPRTGVYNFDQYLQNIMPAEEFDFDSLGAFITSSKDTLLQQLAKGNKKSYVGSTSSMTSALLHFHFLLSDFRPLNFARVSSGFPRPAKTFTEFTRLPSALYLKYKDGVYALDSDKTFDRGTILSQLGQSLEKLLLLPQEEYEQYRLSSPEKVPEEVKNTPEAYHYSTLGNFVFRSQLDGFHDWLPGTGIFDVKTRACVSIRMNQDNYKEMSGYQIRDLYGEWESYEREYVDMLRSTMLKYSLQVRMGRMDGIFVAFHNTEQIFGFQYIPLSEMDLAIHGQENLALGDQEFKLSMQMFSDVLDEVTKEFPEKSLRLHFEARPRSNKSPRLLVFAEPMDDELIETTQAAEIVKGMQELREEVSSAGDFNDSLQAFSDGDVSDGVPSKDILSEPTEESSEPDTHHGNTEIHEPDGEQSLSMQSSAKLETASVVKAVYDSETLQSEHLQDTMRDSHMETPEKQVNIETNVSSNVLLESTILEDEDYARSDTKETKVDMATRYPKAASIFFPDNAALKAVFQIKESVQLYHDIAEQLGKPLGDLTRTQLTKKLLHQASQSPDSMDIHAVRLHLDIERFWRDIEVLRGLSAMELILSNSPGLRSVHILMRDAVSLATKHGADSPLATEQIELVKKSRLYAANATRIYIAALKTLSKFITPTGRIQPHNATNNDIFQQVALGLFGRLTPYNDALGPSTVDGSMDADHSMSGVTSSTTMDDSRSTANQSTTITKQSMISKDDAIGDSSSSSSSASGPLLALSFETVHFINGKAVRNVEDVKYSEQWPVLQEQYRDPKAMAVPSVNKTWTVEYTMTRFSNEQGRRLYKECKARRRRKYEKLADTTDEHHKYFIRIISKWSEKGRQAKKEADKKFRRSSVKQLRKR